MLRSVDKFFLYPILITATIVISITAFFLVIYNHLPNKLPLFYSLSWGETQLAEKQQFFLLPIILIFTCLVNSLLASQLHTAQVVLKKILTLSIILIDVVVLITAIKIIWIFI